MQIMNPEHPQWYTFFIHLENLLNHVECVNNFKLTISLLETFPDIDIDKTLECFMNNKITSDSQLQEYYKDIYMSHINKYRRHNIGKVLFY